MTCTAMFPMNVVYSYMQDRRKGLKEAPGGPGKDTLIPSLQKSPFVILPWVTHDINDVIKGNPPPLSTGGQKLVIGGERGKEFGRSSH